MLLLFYCLHEKPNSQTCHSSRTQSETPAIALPDARHALDTFALFSGSICPYFTNFIYVIIEHKLPLSEFPLPYLPISINCPSPWMTGLSIAGEPELKVPHTDTHEAFS